MDKRLLKDKETRRQMAVSAFQQLPPKEQYRYLINKVEEDEGLSEKEKIAVRQRVLDMFTKEGFKSSIIPPITPIQGRQQKFDEGELGRSAKRQAVLKSSGSGIGETLGAMMGEVMPGGGPEALQEDWNVTLAPLSLAAGAGAGSAGMKALAGGGALVGDFLTGEAADLATEKIGEEMGPGWGLASGLGTVLAGSAATNAWLRSLPQRGKFVDPYKYDEVFPKAKELGEGQKKIEGTRKITEQGKLVQPEPKQVSEPNYINLPYNKVPQMNVNSVETPGVIEAGMEQVGENSYEIVKRELGNAFENIKKAPKEYEGTNFHFKYPTGNALVDEHLKKISYGEFIDIVDELGGIPGNVTVHKEDFKDLFKEPDWVTLVKEVEKPIELVDSKKIKEMKPLGLKKGKGIVEDIGQAKRIAVNEAGKVTPIDTNVKNQKGKDTSGYKITEGSIKLLEPEHFTHELGHAKMYENISPQELGEWTEKMQKYIKDNPDYWDKFTQTSEKRINGIMAHAQELFAEQFRYYVDSLLHPEKAAGEVVPAEVEGIFRKLLHRPEIAQRAFSDEAKRAFEKKKVIMQEFLDRIKQDSIPKVLFDMESEGKFTPGQRSAFLNMLEDPDKVALLGTQKATIADINEWLPSDMVQPWSEWNRQVMDVSGRMKANAPKKSWTLYDKSTKSSVYDNKPEDVWENARNLINARNLRDAATNRLRDNLGELLEGIGNKRVFTRNLNKLRREGKITNNEMSRLLNVAKVKSSERKKISLDLLVEYASPEGYGKNGSYTGGTYEYFHSGIPFPKTGKLDAFSYGASMLSGVTTDENGDLTWSPDVWIARNGWMWLGLPAFRKAWRKFARPYLRLGTEMATNKFWKTFGEVPLGMELKVKHFHESEMLPQNIWNLKVNRNIYEKTLKSEADELSKRIAKNLTKEERIKVSERIEEGIEVSRNVERGANMARSYVKRIQELLVKAGFPQEEVDKLGPKYLRRVYNLPGAKTMEQKIKVIKDRIAALHGKNFIERGMRQVVNKSATRGTLKDGDIIVELSGPHNEQVFVKKGKEHLFKGYSKVNSWEVKDTKTNTVEIWRDYTKDERLAMGEDLDVSVRLAVFGREVAHDVSLGTSFQYISQNPGFFRASTTAEGDIPKGWVHLSDTKVPNTNILRYGALAGGWVSPEVAEVLKSMTTHRVRFNKGLWKLYNKFLTFWKGNKTFRSPNTQMRNVTTNLNVALLAGTNPADILHRGIKTLAKDPELLERALAAGLKDSDMLHSEHDFAKLLERIDKGRDNNVTRQTLKAINILGHIDRLMARSYELGDSIFKLGHFSLKVEQGLDDRAAMKDALDLYVDYSDIPRGIEFVRDIGLLPFVTWSYKMSKTIGRLLRDYPERAITMLMLLEAYDQLNYEHETGPTDTEIAREYDRLLMRDWKKRGILGTKIGQVRIGTSERGNPVFIDVRSFFPGYDFFQGAISEGFPFSSNPVGQMIFSEVSGTHPFTHKKISTYEDAEGPMAQHKNLTDWVQYLEQVIMPDTPFLPGTRSYNHIGNALVTGGIVPKDVGETYGWTDHDVLGNDLNAWYEVLAGVAGIRVWELDRKVARELYLRRNIKHVNEAFKEAIITKLRKNSSKEELFTSKQIFKQEGQLFKEIKKELEEKRSKFKSVAKQGVAIP